MYSTLNTPYPPPQTPAPQAQAFNPHLNTFPTPHSTHFSSPHSSLPILHSTYHIPHSPLHTPHSPLRTPHSTLHANYPLSTPYSTLPSLHFLSMLAKVHLQAPDPQVGPSFTPTNTIYISLSTNGSVTASRYRSRHFFYNNFKNLPTRDKRQHF